MYAFLRLSSKDELVPFDRLDQQSHAAKFIVKGGLSVHEKSFADPSVTYLSIENTEGKLSGYFILVSEPDIKSIEFRRVLIDQNMLGIGQVAIRKMEEYCQTNFSVNRIWLDVYEDNRIGKHIYRKLGYKKFGQKIERKRKLEFYEKYIEPIER